MVKDGKETRKREVYYGELWCGGCRGVGREELERMRQAAREEKQGVVLEFHPERLINGAERIFHGGDVFIERVAV